MPDVDGQFPGAVEPGLADRADHRAGEPVAELVRGLGPQQRGKRGRGVVTARGRQLRDAWRQRRVRAEGGGIESADRLPPVEVHAVVPQLAVRREGAGDRRALRAGPARLVGAGLVGVELGEHAEEQRDADGGRGRGYQQPDEGLPSAAEGESQAEPEHQFHALRGSGRGGGDRGQVDGGDEAVADHGHALGIRRDPRVVGDDDDRSALLARQPGHQVHDLLARQRVERSGRLIGEDDLRGEGERPGDRYALALTAGQLAGPAAALVADPEPFQPGVGGLVGHLALGPVQQQWQRHVIGGGEFGHELPELEHKAERGTPQPGALSLAHRVQHLAVEQRLACVRGEDPGQAVQERRLARAARAHDREDLALADRYARAAQRGGLTECLEDAACLDQAAAAYACGHSGSAHQFLTASASSCSRADVRSIHRRSASRWKRAWSARSTSTRGPVRLISVSRCMRRM